MKIILLGMLIIFLLGMTAQLVVYTIMAYIKEDCSRKMMRTVFVKNTILRYEECTKLGIPVDNVKRFVENTFDSCIYGGYSPDLIADVSKKSGNIIMVMGILSVIFHINNLQECFVYISMTLLEVIALRVSEKMTDYNENKKNILIVHNYYQIPGGEDAARIGTITKELPGKVLLKTSIGGRRILPKLTGLQLPRIC